MTTSTEQVGVGCAMVRVRKNPCWLVVALLLLSSYTVPMVDSFVLQHSPSSSSFLVRDRIDTCRYVATGALASTGEEEGQQQQQQQQQPQPPQEAAVPARTKIITKKFPSYNKKRITADKDRSFLKKKTELLFKLTHDHQTNNNNNSNVDEVITTESSSMRINKNTFLWLIDAWGGHEGGSKHQESLVRRMQDLHERAADGPSVTPDVRVFTRLIQSISRSRAPDAGERAERILEWMQRLSESGANPAAKPNGITYTAVIEAYAQSRIPNHYLRTAVLGGGSHASTNTRSNSDTANNHNANRAEDLYQQLEALYETTGNEEVRPTARTFHALIVVWSRSREAGVADHVANILDHMLKENATPHASSFNAVIDAYAKSGEPGAVPRAEAVLKRMQRMYEQTKDPNLQPNTRTYNSLLNAHAKSGEPDAAYKAEVMLENMMDQDTVPEPDVTSFSTVINAWARSHNFGKAEHALKILDRMMEGDQDGNNNHRPNVIIINSVMNACAFTAVGNQLEGGRALDIAHKMFRELEEAYGLQPDSITYGTYLKVCANHMMEEERELRDQLVQAVFKKCCKDGQVGQLVLQQLALLTSNDVYRELTDMNKDDNRKVPFSWRRNVRDRRAPPVTITTRTAS